MYLVYLYCDIPIPIQKYKNTNFIGKNTINLRRAKMYKDANFTIIPEIWDDETDTMLQVKLYTLLKRVKNKSPDNTLISKLVSEFDIVNDITVFSR
jgi:hypothetical protein